MNEIKKIAKINMNYNGYNVPKYLYLNTYDNSVYIKNDTAGADYNATVKPTNLVLSKEPEYFEEDTELLEELKLPYEKINSSDLRVELVYSIPSLDAWFKVVYTYLDYGEDEIMQSFQFQTPINLNGGSY